MIRVEVANHFNEDAFSYGLAQGLADRIRDAVADVHCTGEGADGLILLSTEGIAETLNDITIDLSGCCDEVAERVLQVMCAVQNE